MKITPREVEEKYLYRTPIYLLTGDIETAKFYSNLASASSKLGYYVEDAVKSLIKFPKVKTEALGSFDGKYVLVKQKINKKIPDFVLVDTDSKKISVFEVKTNLKNLDFAQAFGEKIKHEELKKYLQYIFSDYNVILYVVDFFEGPSLKMNHYKDDDVLNTITGREFCEILEVSFDDVMNRVNKSRKDNLLFVQEYKDKVIENNYQDHLTEEDFTIMKFYESD